MTNSDIQRVADEVVNRLQPLLITDKNTCEMMHRGLVEEFKAEIVQGREDFKTEMVNIRDNIFEKATGKKWEDREQVRDGISFAIAAELLAKRAVYIVLAVCVVSLCAWLGLR